MGRRDTRKLQCRYLCSGCGRPHDGTPVASAVAACVTIEVQGVIAGANAALTAMGATETFTVAREQGCPSRPRNCMMFSVMFHNVGRYTGVLLSDLVKGVVEPYRSLACAVIRDDTSCMRTLCTRFRPATQHAAS